MEFTRKKLPEEAAPTLRMCPIHTVRPYAPLLAPAYVFMKANAKFVAVKAPMDFFTTEELERYASFETIYFPEFVDSALPFRDAARAVRSLLGWRPEERQAGALPPASFEAADAVLRIVGPLWSNGVRIEPFFVSVFANELCLPIEPATLKLARDQDVESYERGMFCSGWVVLLALLLGYTDLGFLNLLRNRVFSRVSGTGSLTDGDALGETESDRLVRFAIESIPDSRLGVIWGKGFDSKKDRIALRLRSRLERVSREFIRADEAMATIYGARGFLNV